MSRKRTPAIADEQVMSKIHTVRGHKVMLDHDLAELYGVETKRLKEQVRRNIQRFPAEFMFELNIAEAEALATSDGKTQRGRNIKYRPFAFTEHGVLMLSNVLRSAQAIAMSIRIIQVFMRMREVLTAHQELLLQVEKLRGTVSHHSRDIKVIFHHIKRMEKEEENRRLLAQIAKEKRGNTDRWWGSRRTRTSGSSSAHALTTVAIFVEWRETPALLQPTVPEAEVSRKNGCGSCL